MMASFMERIGLGGERTSELVGLAFASCFTGSIHAQMLSIDVDGNGIPDSITAATDGGSPLFVLTRSDGSELVVHGLPASATTEIRVLPPADLDGDGCLDLVIGTPFSGSGRVWVFGGAASAVGSLHASQATFCIQSAMPGAVRFGEALGLLPGDAFGGPPCLRVCSTLDVSDGDSYPRVEVFRLDTARLLLVAEGHGSLTDVWADRGDGTRDGVVDALDVPLSLGRVGSLASYGGDLDGDGLVTVGDVALLVGDAALASSSTVGDWSSVVQAMMQRRGGVAEWGMPMLLVSAGPGAQPPAPTPSGTGVFYCARPKDGPYWNWPWYLAPFCHAYLQIGDWTQGFGGNPVESLNDGRSRKCWEARKRSTGSMTVGGAAINCEDATIEQIQRCVKDLAMAGGVCQQYHEICNNCGDWVMDILDACCLEGSYLPYLVY
jgi:hypothetical protein